MAWHYMKPNDSTALPRYIVFLDCETWPADDPGYPDAELHSLRLGVAQFGRVIGGKLMRRREIVFKKQRDFWMWLKDLTGDRHTVWLVAHNLGFDITVAGLWPLITANRIKFCSPGWSRGEVIKRENEKGKDGALVVVGDPPTILGLELPGGGRVLAVDSLNWFKMSLAKLGESVGLAKLDMPEWEAPDDDWIAYCRRDVDILREGFMSLVNFVEDNDLGRFRYTSAAQAMGSYRHRFMTHEICLHDEADVKEHERRAYFGGQTECFYVGKVDKPVWQYDVNSLYPFVMKEFEFPTKLYRWDMGRAMCKRMPDIYVDRSICEVEVESDAHAYPVRFEDKPYYCCGRFTTTLAGPELKRAYESGHIRKWGRFACYKTEPIFSKFVDHFWELRKYFEDEGNQAFASLCKMMLNSLHGKFGQKSSPWQYCPEMVSQGDWERFVIVNATDKTQRIFQCIGSYVFEQVEPAEHSKNFPAVSAFVTAYGREHMRRLRAIAGKEEVYYQATDSIAVSAKGAANLEQNGNCDQDRMGYLSLECYGPDAQFSQVNNYRIGTKRVYGGRKASSIEQPNGSWVEHQFDGLKGVFSRGGPDTIRVTKITKKFSGRYAKGRVLPSGEVNPFMVTGPDSLKELVQ